MTPRRLFQGGRWVLPSGIADAEVLVQDQRIVAVGAPGTLQGDEHTDTTGLLVMPGAVDMHVHFRDPGFTHKEDFPHGTAAAACGGVTTVCDMPNTYPPVTSAAEFARKRDNAVDRAYVDFGLWAGGTRSEEFRGMAEFGAVGLKVYMVKPSNPDDPYSQDLSVLDDARLLEVLQTSAELGWPVSVHVTNPSLEEARRQTLRAAGRTDPRAICEAYGGVGPLEALRRVLLFAVETRARIHIAHLSLAPLSCLDEVRRARKAGVEVTAETLPPVLDIDEVESLGTRAVPHVLSNSARRRFWQALHGGTIDAVATDHAPHLREEKDTDVWSAPPGYPGIETSFPLMLDGALRGQLSLVRLAQVMATVPAKLLALEVKGAIAPGYDADFVLIDPERETTVDEQRLHSKAGWSPFHGRRLRGRLVATWLRGRQIAQDGELVVDTSAGRQVLPQQSCWRQARQPYETP